VTSALTLIMRLQQIACGFLVDDAGITHQLPCAKIGALVEILEEIPGKALIWCCFHNDVELVHAKLSEEYGPRAAVRYYGSTSDEDRAEALRRFHSDPETRFFIGTPATGGRSLTLVEASTAIYYSCNYNLEHRLQSEDRIHRIGQKNTATIIDIVCNDTVDVKVVAGLRSKKNLAESVLSNIRTILTVEDEIPM
jgi:SNF2 family DNA or RNA helicase